MKGTQRLCLLPAALALVLGGGANAAVPTASPSPPLLEGDLAAALQRFRTPGAANFGLPVVDRELRVGHLDLYLQRGVLYALLDADGMLPMGFLFEGTGRYRYVSEDPVDRRIISLGTKRPRKRAAADPVVEGPLRRVIFQAPAGRLGRQLLDGAVTGRVPGAVPMRRASLQAFKRLWRFTPPWGAHLFLLAALHGGHQRLAFAEIESGPRRLSYRLDAVQHDLESLTVYRRQPKAREWEQTLSSVQPANGARSLAPLIVLVDASLALTTKDNRSASISSELTLEAGRDGVRLAVFELAPPRRRSGDRQPVIRVGRVTGPRGRLLDFHHEGGYLLVDLGRELRRGQRYRLRVETEAEGLFTAVDGTRGQDYFELLTKNWHPRPIGWPANRFTFSIRARTHKPFVPVVPGQRIAIRENGDSVEIEAVCRVPVPYVGVAGGKFRGTHLDGGELPVRVHTLRKRGEHLERLARLARSFVRFYESFLGPYPYEALDLVEVPGQPLGLAGPGIVVLANRRSTHPRDRLPVDRGLINHLAHEIAHQWFGLKATIGTPRDNWLSESLAEYLAGIAVREVGVEPGPLTVPFPRLARVWWRQAVRAPAMEPVLAANQLSGQDRWWRRSVLLYSRGPAVLRMFDEMVGRDNFRVILRRLLDEAADEPLTTMRFLAVTNEVQQADFGWFFEQWLRSGGVPEVRVSHELHRNRASGAYVLAGRLEQREGTDFKIVHVPLVTQTVSGERSVHWIVQRKPVTRFRIELPEKPDKVFVDPSKRTLVRYRHPDPRTH